MNMTKSELLELIRNGENSYVEFNRDDVSPASLAKEMSALLNTEGGFILIGVENNGRITGMSRDCYLTKELVMNTSREYIQPPIIPGFGSVQIENHLSVGILKLNPDSSSKPYKAWNNDSWITYVRTSSTSREATREEEGRLYQLAGLVNYETKVVPDMGLDNLDQDRIENYFRVILERPISQDIELQELQRILLNSDLLAKVDNTICTTVAGLLLFGMNPNRRLTQAGVMAVAFPGTEKDYNTIDEERICGPLVSLFSKCRSIVDSGVIDRSINFVKRNMAGIAWLEGGRRNLKKALPIDAVREAIVNAVTHRDYGHEGTDIELSMYEDRLEIISPGPLPNGVTVEKMKEGIVRVTRNGLIKEILRDYGYVDHYGMGVRNRIFQSMLDHNGTIPDLIEEEDRFKVCLWTQPLRP